MTFERLTMRNSDGQAMMDCQKCEADWTGKHGKPMADCTVLPRSYDILRAVASVEKRMRERKELPNG